MKIDRLVYVSTIIKNHAAQALFYRDRKACLGIENEELPSTSGNGYFGRTTRGIIFGRTQQRVGLLSGGVQGESAQAVRSSRKEEIRKWNMTPRERRDQAQTNIVGPNEPGPNLLVIGSLPEKARDV